MLRYSVGFAAQLNIKFAMRPIKLKRLDIPELEYLPVIFRSGMLSTRDFPVLSWVRSVMFETSWLRRRHSVWLPVN